MIRAGGGGMFHITNEGSCSWYEYAAQMSDYAGLRPELSPTTAEAYGAKAARHACSGVVSERLEPLGSEPLPPWRDALRRYLAQKGHLDG